MCVKIAQLDGRRMTVRIVIGRLCKDDLSVAFLAIAVKSGVKVIYRPQICSLIHLNR